MKSNLYVIKIQRNRYADEEHIATKIRHLIDKGFFETSVRTDNLKAVLKFIKQEVVIVSPNRRSEG